MISIPVAATIGAALGAATLGIASAASGDITGLGVALSHVPEGTQGYTVVSAVSNTLAGGAVGGSIGAAIAAAAKVLVP